MPKRYFAYTDQTAGAADLESRLVHYNTKATAGYVGNSVADDRNVLNTLLNVTMQPNGGILDVTGVPRIASALAIPSNVQLRFINGAFLAPDGGVTVTHNGELAYTRRKIFGGGGAVVFGTGSSISKVWPAWWGAAGDNVTDSSAALQSAATAAPDNSTIAFGNGTFLLGAGGMRLLNKTNVHVRGFNAKVRLTAAGTLVSGAGNPCSILLDNCTRCTISGFEIDGNAKLSDHIALKTCTDCVVEKNVCYTGGFNGLITTFGGTRNTIRNNNVSLGLGGIVHGIYAGDYTALKLETDVAIINNVSRGNQGDGIVCVSVGGLIKGNRCFSNFSGIIVAGFGGFSAARLTISLNVCKGNSAHGIQSDVIWATDADTPSDILIKGNVCSDNAGAGIYALRVLRWTISGNTCRDNVTAGIVVGRFSRVSLSANICCDTRVGGARTQLQGISIIAENGINSSELSVLANICSNNAQNGISAGNVAAETIDSGVFTGNICNGNGTRGIDITEATAGSLTKFVVTGNVAQNNTTIDIRCTILDLALGDNQFTTNTSLDAYTFTNLAATPSVKGARKMFKCANAGATVITNFLNPTVGQVIRVWFSTANTTINAGGNFVLKGALNLAPVPGNAVMEFMWIGVWLEISRNF